MPTPFRDLLFRNRSKDADERSSDVHSAASAAEAESSPPAVIHAPSQASEPQQSNFGSAQTWAVRMPPVKKHMVGGYLVPTARTAIAMFSQRRRMVRIEVRSTKSAQQLDSAEAQTLEDSDVLLLRVFRPPKRKGFGISSEDSGDSDEDEDSLVSGTGTLPPLGMAPEDEHLGKELKRYKFEDVHILKDHKNTVEVKLGSGNEVVIRDIKFETDQDAREFMGLCNRLGTLVQERTQRQVALYKGSKDKRATDGTRALPGMDDDLADVEVLVEIVGATNLPAADLSSSDPYVIVRMAGKEIHRTKVVPKDLDPIWTLEKGSLFLLQMSPETFFASTGGMTFVLKDYDSVGSNDILGTVSVPLDDILKGTGVRSEYAFDLDRKMVKKVKKKGNDSILSLRFRRPSESDKEFMEVFRANEKKLGMYINETYLPVRPPASKLLHGQKKKGANGSDLYRVKPFPDPLREEETKWMSEDQINKMANESSTHWVESGSGDYGKVYFEIIGCDGLPNMDTATLNVRDKTDAFACVLFEDCICNTDVISDSLSPRWPPWCRRAFAFNIAHPASDVMLAIFDYDPELSPTQLLSRTTSDLHDPIGRVRVNLSKLAPSTTYDLTYQLYYGELKEHREKNRGTVHIRIRIEFSDVRKAMVAGMMPQESNVVSVANKVDFATAHYAADGIVDERDFSMNLFAKYVNELESYQIILEYLAEAALVVWLWRAHHNLSIAGKTIKLPLHSLVNYIWAILVTWNFNLFPSFLLFSVGWALLATNEHVQKNPSPWKSSRGYFSMLRLFLLNMIPPETIPENYKLEEIAQYDAKMELEEENRRKRKKLEQKHEEEVMKEFKDEIEQAEGEDVDIASGKTSLLPGVNVNPLKPILFPIQKELRKIVSMVRVVKTIVLWEETYFSFWIVSFAFLGSALVVFVPWAFLLRWTLRIAAWVLLGPWMMLVDKYYFQKQLDNNSDEAIRNRIKARYANVMESALHSRVRNECALKLKSMKRFCFGKFLVNVPVVNDDLYWDHPLPSSTARPCLKADHITVAERRFGQKLSGDMIPKREVQVDKPVAAENRKKPLWKRNIFRRKKAQSETEQTPLLSKGPSDGGDSYQAVGATSKGYTKIQPEVVKGTKAVKVPKMP